MSMQLVLLLLCAVALHVRPTAAESLCAALAPLRCRVSRRSLAIAHHSRSGTPLHTRPHAPGAWEARLVHVAPHYVALRRGNRTALLARCADAEASEREHDREVLVREALVRGGDEADWVEARAVYGLLSHRWPDSRNGSALAVGHHGVCLAKIFFCCA